MSKGVELESSNKCFFYKFITFYKHILRMPYFKSRLRGKIQISLTSQFLRFHLISSQQKICSYFSSGSNDTYFAFKLLTLIHQLNGVNGEIQMDFLNCHLLKLYTRNGFKGWRKVSGFQTPVSEKLNQANQITTWETGITEKVIAQDKLLYCSIISH